MSVSTILNDFTILPSHPWRTFVKGGGHLELRGQTIRLVNENTLTDMYTDAQLDDYQGLSRHKFYWHPPLTLQVQACFSHGSGVLSGTAGFGFWNDPFAMTEARWPAWPCALWFFYSSPPSNMKLEQHTPGPSWKAATIDARRWPFFALLPFAPIAVPLMNVSWLYRLCWPIGQRAIHVNETSLAVDMTTWHDYTIVWQSHRVIFSVDEQIVLDCHTSPKGPLGFVAWLDNQYMIVTPWGNFGYGLLAKASQQWMELSHIIITHKI